MKKFRLELYDKVYVDASEYYPLKILPMSVNIELLQLVDRFNAFVFKESKGVYYGTSKKPLAYFPIEFILDSGNVIIAENLEEFKIILLDYKREIKQITRFGLDKPFLLRHIEYLSEYTRYPYFLDLFCYSLELEYNSGVLLSEYLVKSPFQNSTQLCLYHPDELKYADIKELMLSKDLETIIPDFDNFTRIANRLIDNYCSEISKIMNDPYRTIKVNYLTGINTSLNIELIPSIMERWGLLSKHLNK